jgi:hypothetical protein
MVTYKVSFADEIDSRIVDFVDWAQEIDEL